MPYTEIKERNKRRYFYRVLSVRKGKRVEKRRKYLGVNLNAKNLPLLEEKADQELIVKKTSRNLEKITKKIIPILKKTRVKKAGIFGSYARGEQEKNSDIDILIEPPKGLGFGFVALAQELEKLLRKKVDLLTYNSLHPLLKKRILSEEKQIL